MYTIILISSNWFKGNFVCVCVFQIIKILMFQERTYNKITQLHDISSVKWPPYRST